MIKNLEEAVKVYKQKCKDAPYDLVVETPTWYIFSYNKDHVIADPIGINKRTGECRGVVPPFDIKDYDKGEIVWDRRS